MIPVVAPMVSFTTRVLQIHAATVVPMVPMVPMVHMVFTGFTPYTSHTPGTPGAFNTSAVVDVIVSFRVVVPTGQTA